MKTLKELDLRNKKVIIRCDLNVPIKNGVITDDNRIVESLPTIKYVLEQNAKVIIMSHLGRVEKEEDKKEASLKPVADKLSAYLNVNVTFTPKTRDLEEEINKLDFGQVLVIENTRFEDVPNNLESGNDKDLGAYWASLGDIFINDAFGTAHRAHASNVGIATNIEEKGIGFLVEKELEVLNDAIQNPKRPFTVILGGAKIKDKIGVIENLVNIADNILICGGMVYTFLKALGYNIGSSILDENNIEFCKKIYEEHKDKIILPIDVVCAKEFKNESPRNIRKINEIQDGENGMDTGPESLAKMKEILEQSKLVIWNGPCGVMEFENFAVGTKEILEILKNIDAEVIIGGGDSGAAAIQFGYKDAFTRISTGGGATLTLLEGKALPGIECME